MSVDRLIQRARRVADLDQQCMVELLQHLLRTGSIERWRAELAAYCGHEAARVLVPCECGPEGWSWEACWCNGDRPLQAWLRGLNRWEGALMQAFMAAPIGPRSDQWMKAWAASAYRTPVGSTLSAARYWGESVVRTAICKALIEWALGEAT